MFQSVHLNISRPADAQAWDRVAWVLATPLGTIEVFLNVCEQPFILHVVVYRNQRASLKIVPFCALLFLEVCTCQWYSKAFLIWIICL